MSTIGQPVELSFEILHDATGAQILAPTGLRLYLVKPGTQVLEYIPGQVFEPVGGGVIKTTIPGGEINVMGLYRAVDPLDFVHLFDSFAAPTAFYMVRILATELTGAGTLAYGVDWTDMEVWRHDLVIQDQPYVDFTIKTNPWLDNVSGE